jgi:hypothetical protein
MRRFSAAGAALTACLLSACGAADRVEQAAPADAPSPATDPRTRLTCQGMPVDLTRLASLPRATELEPSAQRALRRWTYAEVGDLSAWRILDLDGAPDDHRTIGRELTPAEGRKARSEETVPNFRAISIFEGTSGGGGGTDGWRYAANTSCELRPTFDGLAVAQAWLDPNHPAPRRGDTAVHLRVSERACAGGRPAGERITLADMERTADELRIAIGVVPQNGAFTCPGNPREAFTVELDEPLGDERVLDSGVYPPRPFAQYRPGEG